VKLLEEQIKCNKKTAGSKEYGSFSILYDRSLYAGSRGEASRLHVCSVPGGSGVDHGLTRIYPADPDLRSAEDADGARRDGLLGERAGGGRLGGAGGRTGDRLVGRGGRLVGRGGRLVGRGGRLVDRAGGRLADGHLVRLLGLATGHCLFLLMSERVSVFVQFDYRKDTVFCKY
jgi:hypothetical protein